MEEKKDPKKVAQEEAKKLRAKVEGTARPQQLSYEQLNNIAHQLSEQNMQLRRQLQAIEASNFFKRLDYLFKVAEFSHMFEEDFVDACTAEIQSALTIPTDQPDDGVSGDTTAPEAPEEENPPLEPETEELEELEGIHG